MCIPSHLAAYRVHLSELKHVILRKRILPEAGHRNNQNEPSSDNNPDVISGGFYRSVELLKGSHQAIMDKS
jgi:hypothetical protein